MSIELKTFSEAREVDAGAWAALTDNPYESPGWFRAVEETCAQTRFRYFCAYEHGRLRALLPAYDRHAPVEPNTITCLMPAAGRRMTRLAGLTLRRAPLTALIAGSPYSFFSDVIGDPDLDGVLIEAMRAHAEARGTDLLSILYARRPVSLPGALSGRCLDDFVVDLPGDSFEDFASSFKKRKSRNKRRQELRRAPPAQLLPLAGHGDIVSELGLITARRHGHVVPVPAALYENLAARMGDSARILLSGSVEDPQAVLVVLLGENSLSLFHIGVRERDKTYFEIAFAHTIRTAYELGRRHMNFRPAGAVAKTLRGCRAVTAHYFIKLMTPRARALHGALRFGARLSGGG